MMKSEMATVIVTDASSGVGLHATKALADRGWHVVMAYRDMARAEAAASGLGIASGGPRALPSSNHSCRP